MYYKDFIAFCHQSRHYQEWFQLAVDQLCEQESFTPGVYSRESFVPGVYSRATQPKTDIQSAQEKQIEITGRKETVPADRYDLVTRNSLVTD